MNSFIRVDNSFIRVSLDIYDTTVIFLVSLLLYFLFCHTIFHIMCTYKRTYNMDKNGKHCGQSALPCADLLYHVLLKKNNK